MLFVSERIRNVSKNLDRPRLRAWRKHLGMTQEEVAQRLSTDKGTVSKLERGRQRLTDDWLQAFARAYDVKAKRLYDAPPGGDGSPIDELLAIVEPAPEQLQRQILEVARTLVKTHA